MVPLNERALCYLLSKPKPKIDDEYFARGRIKLTALKDVINVVFNESKTSPGLGVLEDEISDIATEEMIKKISCNPSKRTLDRHLNDVKVTSVMHGGFL